MRNLDIRITLVGQSHPIHVRKVLMMMMFDKNDIEHYDGDDNDADDDDDAFMLPCMISP